MMLLLLGFQELTFSHSLGGTFDRDPRAVCFHTTQGVSVQGAVSVYKAIQAAPHLTVDPETHEKFQHVPLDRSSYALRNLPGGCNTNTTGIIQVEIVGYAADTWSWSTERLKWLGEEVLKPILDACPTIPRGPIYEGPRMTCPEWDVPGGLAGHRDVPEQDHTDPGDLDLAAILAYATGEDMALTDDDVERIAKRTTELMWARVVKNVPNEAGVLADFPIENVVGFAYIQALRAHLAVADLAKVAITTGPVDPHGGV